MAAERLIRIERVRRWRRTATWFALIGMLYLQVAAQVFAFLCDWHASLGKPIHGLYPFWRVISWWSEWDHLPFATFASQLSGVPLAAIASLAVINRHHVTSAISNTYSYGRNHWATLREMRDARLLPGRFFDREARKGGFYLGLTEGARYLIHTGIEHAMLVAGTRVGKSIGPIMMWLLSRFDQCAIVLDMKKELVHTKAVREAHGHRCYVLEWADPSSNKCNPLNEVDIDGPHAVADAQRIANMLSDPDGKGHGHKNQPHFDESAEAFLVGLILYALRVEKNGGPIASIPGLGELVSDPSSPIDELLTSMEAMWRTDPVVAMCAADQRARPADEGGSVMSTLKRYLTVYRDPIVAANVSGRSDFRLHELVNGSQPTTLYLVTSPADRKRLEPVARLFITMMIASLTRKVEVAISPEAPWWKRLFVLAVRTLRSKRAHKYTLKLVLDEVRTLGTNHVFQDALSYMAGYGISALMAWQSMSQVFDLYGQHENITGQCEVKLFYPAPDLPTAKFMAELAGTTSAVQAQTQVSGWGGKVTSRSYSEREKPLLSAGEAAALRGPRKSGGEESPIVAPGEVVAFRTGFMPMRLTQPLTIFDDSFVKLMGTMAELHARGNLRKVVRL